MKKLVTILNVCCLAMLLLSNLVRTPLVQDNSNTDMESVAGMTDTEETKIPTGESAFMEEQELATSITGLLTFSEKAAFYIRHTSELQWQHTEMPLLPPEPTSSHS